MRSKTLVFLSILATVPTWAAYKDTVLADHPAGYWRLDAVPPVVLSYATNIGWLGDAANGVINNFTREGVAGAIAGDTDKAMQFTGHGSSRVVVPFDAALNPAGAFTFECWMKPACKLGNAQALVVNRSGESGYTIYVNGDGSFGFNVSKGAAGGYWSSAIITNVPAVTALVDRWTHVACVFDGAASTYGTQYIYTNGVLAASLEMNNWFVPNPGGQFIIGDRLYSGCLDEVAVYDAALTEADLAAHYAAGTDGSGGYKALVQAANPVGYWRLGETGGFNITPTVARNLGSLGARENATYDLGTRLDQPGALVGSANKAAYFDGMRMMQAPPGMAANPTPTFSVEFWAKPAIAYTGGTAQAVPVGGTDRDFGRSGWLFYQGGNGWSWWLGLSSTTTYSIQLDPVTPVVADQWYHVVGTYDGTTARLYVNGVEVASKAGAFNPNSSRPITAGGRYDGSYGYQGGLDEIAIYPGVLSAGDVLAHYQNGINPAPSQTYDSLVLAQGPIAYWRLDEPAPASYPGVSNSGYLGAAADGQVVGDLALTTDTPLVGDSNAAVDFTTGGRIAIPFDPALNRTNAFSYEVWYNQTVGTGTSHRCPLWWRDEPVLGDTRGWVHYIVGSGNTFQSSDVYTTWNGLGSTTLFEQGAWQHLVCTFDGKVKKMYLNGVLIAVSTTEKLAVKPVTRAVTTISSASYPWLGSLDEVAIYTNALPVERIQAHYIAARNANPPAVAPTFGVDATGVSSFEGATVSVRTLVLGTAPFTYQWYKGTTPVAGQTTDTLRLSPAKESDSGDYKLLVSNAGGSAESAIATVTIQKSPPTIVAEPQPAVRLQGSSVTFSVDCGGSLPLNYQWKSNNVAIAGATAPTFTLINIQPSFAANYSVSINNTAGAANSQVVALTVVPVAQGTFAAAVVAAQPIAYWRLNEAAGSTVAHDYVGGHDGAYDPSVTLGEPSAILGDGDPSATFAYGGVIVPYSADLNPYVTFSFEAWAKIDPSGAGTDRPIVWSSTTYAGWAYGYILSANASDTWSFTTGQKTSGFNTLTGGSATNPGWDHLVCTFDDITGDKRLYVNGVLVGQTTTATGTYAPNQRTEDSTPPFDQGIGWDVKNFVGAYGGIDEVAFYSYVLTPDQVGAHYAVGASPSLAISASGAQVTLTWSMGRLLESTSVNSTSWTPVAGANPPTYTVTPTAGSTKFYRAVYP